MSRLLTHNFLDFISKRLNSLKTGHEVNSIKVKATRDMIAIVIYKKLMSLPVTDHEADSMKLIWGKLRS